MYIITGVESDELVLLLEHKNKKQLIYTESQMQDFLLCEAKSNL